MSTTGSLKPRSFPTLRLMKLPFDSLCVESFLKSCEKKQHQKCVAGLVPVQLSVPGLPHTASYSGSRTIRNEIAGIKDPFGTNMAILQRIII